MSFNFGKVKWDVHLPHKDSKEPERVDQMINEKLRLDKETASSLRSSIRNLTTSISEFSKFSLQRDLKDEIELILDDDYYPFWGSQDLWPVPAINETGNRVSLIKEVLRLENGSRDYLSMCLQKQKTLQDTHSVKRSRNAFEVSEVNCLLYDIDSNEVPTIFDKMISLPIRNSFSIESETLFSEETFKMIEPLTLPLLSYIPETKWQNLELLVAVDEYESEVIKSVEPWEVCESALCYKNETWIEEELNFFEGTYFESTSKINDDTQCNFNYELLPDWKLSRVSIVSLVWKIFEGLSISGLESDNETSKEDIQPEKGHIEDRVSSVSFNNDTVDSSNSLETCKAATIQEITTELAFADSMFLNSSKRLLEEDENLNTIDELITLYSKKRKIEETAFHVEDKFPIESLIGFSVSKSTNFSTGNNKQKIIDTPQLAINQEQPIVEFHLKQNKAIILNLSLYKKDKLSYSLIQKLADKGLTINEIDSELEGETFDFFLNGKLGIILFSSDRIDQRNVYSGKRLVLERLDEIRHHALDTMALISVLENPNSIKVFLEELSSIQVKYVLVNQLNYVSEMVKIINSNAIEYQAGKNLEETPDGIFLAECGIRNPFLIREILSKNLLENFVYEITCGRFLAYENLVTKKLLNQLRDVFKAKLNFG